MNMYANWQYDEFVQVGTDYGRMEEVAIYDASHKDFRDVESEHLEIARAVRLSGNDVLADIGAGTGAFACFAAGICRETHAVDVSESMLEFARRRAVGEGVKGIHFHHAGFLGFERAARSLDVVTSSLALHHLPDFWKGIALRRIREMLRPRGRFWLRDVVIPQVDSVACVNAFIEAQADRGGAFLRRDAEVHFRDEFSTCDWVLEGLLERAGFRIEEKDVRDGVLVSYLCVPLG